jgi:signal transduction histidine kinase
MAAIVEAAATVWPLAATLACAVTVDRVRVGRRREALNRALHELRRPLQVMALTRSGEAGVRSRHESSQLDAALAALADLDAEINGGPSRKDRPVLDARRLLAEAVGRWDSPAALLGRELEVELPIGKPVIRAEGEAVARALDNLIANSLEHGASRIRISGRALGGRLRITVADGAARGSAVACIAGPLRRGPGPSLDPRRGHGLGIVARFAAEHGGRFALRRGNAGSIALLELPLAEA